MGTTHKRGEGVKTIRERTLPQRLNEACDLHPHVPPYNYGRLTWIQEQLLEQHGIEVSTETARKWFSGESRPRPDKMRVLAQMLNVDEAWLSLGVTPEMTPRERRTFNVSSEGAVLALAGFIQMGGGHPAFPEEDDPRLAEVNLYAIIQGKQRAMYVALGRNTDGEHRFSFPIAKAKTMLIGVLPVGAFQIEVIRFDGEHLEKAARREMMQWWADYLDGLKSRKS